MWFGGLGGTLAHPGHVHSGSKSSGGTSFHWQSGARVCSRRYLLTRSLQPLQVVVVRSKGGAAAAMSRSLACEPADG